MLLNYVSSIYGCTHCYGIVEKITVINDYCRGESLVSHSSTAYKPAGLADSHSRVADKTNRAQLKTSKTTRKTRSLQGYISGSCIYLLCSSEMANAQSPSPQLLPLISRPKRLAASRALRYEDEFTPWIRSASSSSCYSKSALAAQVNKGIKLPHCKVCHHACC